MKQTAVEWLVDELQKADYIPKDSIIMDYVIKKAKEIEKQQIVDAFDNGVEDDGIIDNAEQYYNETFNKSTP